MPNRTEKYLRHHGGRKLRLAGVAIPIGCGVGRSNQAATKFAARSPPSSAAAADTRLFYIMRGSVRQQKPLSTTPNLPTGPTSSHSPSPALTSREMVVLNVRLSKFRLAAAAPVTLSSPTTLSVKSTTRRICGVESPPVSPNSGQRHVSEISFPLSWAPTWTERLPDRLALRAAALLVEAHTTPKQARLKRITCTPRRRMMLGALRMDFLELSTGTVSQSFRLRDHGVFTPYTLSFEVIVEEPARVGLAVAGVRLWVQREREPCTEFAVSVQHVGGRRVQSTAATMTCPRDDARATMDEGQETLRRGSAGKGERSNLDLRPSLRNARGQQPLTPSASWQSLPTLQLTTSNLAQLAHGALRFRVHKCHADGTRPVAAQDTVPVHRLWASLAYPGHRTPLSLQLSDTITLRTMITADNRPPSGQMNGGVTTDDGITGANPVIFGAPLSDRLRGSVVSGMPSGWVRLLDTFGYRYYRHVKQGVDVWTMPPEDTISEAIRHDEITANQHGFDRGKYGVFRSQDDSSETWIHPAAGRASIVSYGVPEGVVVPPAPHDHENSLSTLDLSDLQNEVLLRSTLKPRVRSELHPAAFTHGPNPHAPTDEAKSRISLDRELSREPVVEMKWTVLPVESFAPGVKCEGHSLTAVNEGKTLLKFGGATGSGGMRLNTLDAFDIESSSWRRINASGVIPAARTGHGAVALGADQSRLLIFGGSSPEGRQNDLHMYHVANETWSPVTCSGAPPEVRARMGMTVAGDASTVLVFGGRSLYRFLGGQYYDALYVNAFHTERSQWVRMRPRGSGPRPAPRSGCVVEFVNQRQMFVHGGYDDGDRFFDDSFLFDMVSSSWQKIAYPNEPTGPSPREGHSSVVLGGNVFVYGGDSKQGLLSDLHIFNSSTLRWDQSPSLVGLGPGRISGAGLAQIGDSEALLVGGDTGFSMTRAAYKLGVSKRSAIDAQGMKELAMERGPDARVCVVCMDAKVETMFLWCGHSVCCKSCSRLVKHVCPVCRQPFSEIVRSTFG